MSMFAEGVWCLRESCLVLLTGLASVEIPPADCSLLTCASLLVYLRATVPAAREGVRNLYTEDGPFDAKAASALLVGSQRLLDTSAYKELQPQLKSMCDDISGRAVFTKSANRKQQPTRSSY